MAYETIDPVINAWAQHTVTQLFNEWAGRPARFAYLPGLRPCECSQIVIEPPTKGRVAVLAVSVDTDDGSEFEQRWEGQADALMAMLDSATEAVRGWANRRTASPS